MNKVHECCGETLLLPVMSNISVLLALCVRCNLHCNPLQLNVLSTFAVCDNITAINTQFLG
jgi:hypothetical protein